MMLRSKLHRLALGAACIWASALAADASAGSILDDHELSGRVSVDGRWYPQSAAHTGQRDHASGFVVAPRLYLENSGDASMTLEGFYRYDSADPHRTHADLREAFLLLLGDVGDDAWELRLGIDRVFWGVAESRHLVDIVNQTDLVEHPNEEAKLGQPMVHFTWSGDWGVAELFGLPYHRLRTYPGRNGRLRTQFVVDNDRALYESAAAEWHLDLAARYSHSLGPFDLGLSVFDGTSREPTLLPGTDGIGLPIPRDGMPILIPYYEKIRQFGLDVQMTSGAWLLKLEAIRREGARNGLGKEENYTALVGGGEYSVYSVFDSGIDLGLLAEWNGDGRRRRATNVFQNDLFLGMRIGFNDVEGTEAILGILEDMDFGTHSFSAELNRRLSDRVSMHLGLLAEWNGDGRRRRATNVFQNDLFLGMRIGFNDVEGTEAILGILEDMDFGTHSFSAELNRRLSDRVSMHLEGVLFRDVDMIDPTHEVRRDSFVELSLIYSF